MAASFVALLIIVGHPLLLWTIQMLWWEHVWQAKRPSDSEHVYSSCPALREAMGAAQEPTTCILVYIL